MSDEPKQPSKWIMQTDRECFIWLGGILFGIMISFGTIAAAPHILMPALEWLTNVR